MTRALALPLCRKKFPQRWEVVKQVKYLLGQKVQHMWIDILADSEGESLSCAHMAVWITYMEHFFQVSFDHSLWFAWCAVHIWYISVSLCMHAYLSQDGPYWKDFWVEHPLTWLQLGFQGAFSARLWLGRSPDSGMRNMCSLQGPASSLNFPLFLSWGFHQ